MDLKQHQKQWDTFAQLDSKWAILTRTDKKFGRWDDQDFFATGRQEIASFLERTRSLGIPLNFNQALDFGCGIGRLTRALSDHFQQVVGVDVSADMIAQAQQHHRDHPRVRFIHNPHPHLAGFADGSFDLVYSFITLQHVPQRSTVENYLREFVRILRPCGLLYFQLPSVPDYSLLRSWLLKLRSGIFHALVRFGVPPQRCFNSLHLAPYMHMTHIPSRRILDLLKPLAQFRHLDHDHRTDTQYFFTRPENR